MKFQSCSKCGGRCCKDFAVPIWWHKTIHGVGIPLELYASTRDPNPRRYFELHKGVTITEDGLRFTIDPEIPIHISNGHVVVGSPCMMLNDKGRCMIYDSRPDMCRNFTAETAQYYIVPEGCKYEKEGGNA